MRRALLVLVTAIIVVLYYAPAGHADYFERWGDGTYGAQTVRQSGQIVAVQPNSPTEHGGVRVGDRVVQRPFHFDATRFTFPVAGETETFRFDRNGRQFAATLTAVPVRDFSALDRVGGFLGLLVPTVFLVVAFILVYARPSAMTWSFYVFAVGYFGTAPSLGYWLHAAPEPVYAVISFVLMAIFGNVSVLLLLPFVLRFPHNSLDGWRRNANALVWTVVIVGYTLSIASWMLFQVKGERAPYQFIIDSILPLVALLAATGIVIQNLKVAARGERERFRFMIIATVLSLVGYAAYFLPTDTGAQTAAQLIVQNLAVLMPIAVGYAVLRHRVLDVNFVLNRAIVYSGLSVVIIAVVSLMDWFASRIVSEQRLTTAVELMVTIVVGFLLDRINRSFSTFVDRVFFRKRHDAERYLRRAAAALPYATDERAVGEGLLYEPVRALDLNAAALYRLSADGERFTGIGTSSDTLVAPPGFDMNDALVRFLEADEDLVWLDQLRAASSQHIDHIYVLAIPVTLRHQVVAIALYGAHRNGAQIDPEEVDLLKELAREAARAYDHVEAVRIREQLQKLREAAAVSG